MKISFTGWDNSAPAEMTSSPQTDLDITGQRNLRNGTGHGGWHQMDLHNCLEINNFCSEEAHQEEIWTQRYTQRKGDVKTQEEDDSPPQAKWRSGEIDPSLSALRRNQSCEHLKLRLADFRTGRQ
ncbi:uncharacterized protein LOC132679183 [Panthera onca]